VKLLTIDFSNLVIRHASNPYSAEVVDIEGHPMGGAVGALKQVLRLIEREKPTHLLIARDGKRDASFRRDIDPTYKAHRPDADDDLRRQFIAAYQGVEILRLPCIVYDRHEADDVIASACARFPGPVTIVSGDKDMLALVNEKVELCLLRPGGEKRCRTAADVIELFGVSPNQVRDFKSICGDASDGIKGVPGVGKGGASAIIAACGSLAECYRRIDAGEEVEGVKPHVLKKMAEGREQARIAWQLVGMIKNLDVPVESLALKPIPANADVLLGDAGLAWLWSEIDYARARAAGEAV
jgi:DNA polymerase-1